MTNTGFKLKLPRGRPKGSSPKPGTVAEFVQLSLSQPFQPPSRPKPEFKGKRNGIWSQFKTPEERSAYARTLAAKRNPKNMARTKRRTGTPNGWSGEAARVAKAQAALEADHLVEKLQSERKIPRGDAEAVEATRQALIIVRSPGAPSRKREMAERLLAHYHPELRERAHG
jgi:hypothetical protein